MNAPVIPLPVKRLRRWTWPDWPAGLYEDAAGHHFDGELTRSTVDQAIAVLGRYRAAPAMLADLTAEGTLDLARTDMAGVVAAAWTATRIPETGLARAGWVELFRANGFNAERPSEPVRLFRGCIPQWLHRDQDGRVVGVDLHGCPEDPYDEIVESTDTRTGMGWTTRLAVARRHANPRRHAYAIAPGAVYAATVSPEHLLAAINDAVIVDPAGLCADDLEPIALKAAKTKAAAR